MNEQVAGSPTPRFKRRITIAVASSAIVASVVLTIVFRDPPAEIPAPPLEGVYTEVAAAITEAKTLVEQSPSNGAVWGNYGMVLAAHEYITEPIVCFREATRLSPHEMKWWYYLADMHEFSDRAFAIKCFKKARGLASRAKPLIDTRLADLLLVSGEMVEARSLLVEAISDDPTNDRARLSLARIALAEDKPEEALEHLTAGARQYQPLSLLRLTARVHRELGNSKLEQETLKAAEEAVDDGWHDPLLLAIQRCRVDPHWLALQAKQAIEAGNAQEGMATLKRLTQLHPTELTFRIALVRHLIFRKQYHEAGKLLTTSAPTSASFDILRWRGTLSILQEDWAAAIKALESAVEIKPASAQTKRDLGFAYEQAMQLDKALAVVSEAAQLDSSEPEFAIARIKLLKKLNRENDVAAAIDQFKARFTDLDVEQELRK